MNGSLIPYPRSVYWCCPVCVRHAGRYGRRTGWAAGRSLVLGGSQATQGERSRAFWMPTVHTDLEVGQSQQDRHVRGFAWLWDRTSETSLWEPGECGPGLCGPSQWELPSAETRKSEPVNFVWHRELRTMSAEHASGLWPDRTGRAWREYGEAGTCWAARGNWLSVSRSSKIYKTKQNKIENRWGPQIQGMAARPLLRKSKAIKPARQELLGFLVVLSQSTQNA